MESGQLTYYDEVLYLLVTQEKQGVRCVVGCEDIQMGGAFFQAPPILYMLAVHELYELKTGGSDDVDDVHKCHDDNSARDKGDRPGDSRNRSR